MGEGGFIKGKGGEGSEWEGLMDGEKKGEWKWS